MILLVFGFHCFCHGFCDNPAGCWFCHPCLQCRAIRSHHYSGMRTRMALQSIYMCLVYEGDVGAVHAVRHAVRAFLTFAENFLLPLVLFPARHHHFRPPSPPLW